MNKERDPKSVPIHIAFGAHDKKYSSSINTLIGIGKSHLKSSKSGEVVFFSENADNDTLGEELSVKSRSIKTSLGVSQLEAYINLTFRNIHHREPSRNEIKKMKKEIPHVLGFPGYELKKIDSLDRKNPGRVAFVFEKGLPEDELIENKKRTEKAIEAGEKTIEWVYEGEFLKALPFFQERIILMAEEFKRDAAFAETFLEEVNKPNVIATVGHIGAIHTETYHKLKREGYNVIPIFPQKQGKTYLYHPFAAAARSRYFFPEKIYSQEQCLKTLVQNEIYNLLEFRRSLKFTKIIGERSPIIRKWLLFLRFDAMPYIPKTEQEVLRLVYKATNDFDIEKINGFEDLVREKGFVMATANLMRPYLNPKRR